MTPEQWAQRVMSHIAQDENALGRHLTDKEQMGAIAAVFAETAPRWIPVTGRLPAVDVLVIVVNGKGVCCGKLDVALHKGQPVFWTQEDYFECDISHWMPLPTGP
jgi:hypothetical protein